MSREFNLGLRSNRFFITFSKFKEDVKIIELLHVIPCISLTLMFFLQRTFYNHNL